MTQPPPTPSTGDVWQELIDVETDPALRELMIARRQLGIERYGTPLQRGNGRDAERDYREELLDAMVYAQALGRTGNAAVLRALLSGLVSGRA